MQIVMLRFIHTKTFQYYFKETEDIKMARPRRQTYTMKQYIDNLEDGYISNNAAIQRYPAWKPIVDGLAVTILTDDYIPAIILAEEKSGKTVIVDGGSRTVAFRMICKGNYKIKSSVEDPIIQYKKMEKDSNGKTVWSDAEFDIRNKTFEQFPKELQKKFYEYQVETVIHECDSEKIAKYFRRYNVHTGMNANQKMFIYLPKFADKVKDIANREFFLNYSVFTNSNKEKGLLERVVAESVMTMFHFDKWNKNGKKLSTYLNQNASEEEFNVLADNITRLENIITEDTKTLFNDKNTFIWLTIFNEFTKLGLDDTKFSEFLYEFINVLRNKPVDGKLFDKADESGSTKDKSVITAKLHILKTLMYEYLHINEEDINEVDTLEFIKDNIDPDVEENDVEQYEEVLDDLTLNVDNSSKLMDEQNRLSLVAMVAYSFKHDIDLDDWLVKFFEQNTDFIRNQKQNYLHMVENLNQYISCQKQISA